MSKATSTSAEATRRNEERFENTLHLQQKAIQTPPSHRTSPVPDPPPAFAGDTPGDPPAMQPASPASLPLPTKSAMVIKRHRTVTMHARPLAEEVAGQVRILTTQTIDSTEQTALAYFLLQCVRDRVLSEIPSLSGHQARGVNAFSEVLDCLSYCVDMPQNLT